MAINKIDAYQINVPTGWQWGIAASKPAATGTGYYYFETDTGDLFQDQGAWVQLNSGSGSSVSGQTIIVLPSDDNEDAQVIPGPKGETGVAGSAGATGSAGAMGAPGMSGEDGEEGQATPGPKGDAGATGAAGSEGRPGGASVVLFDHYADAGNITTGETDLYSDTLAAGQLANNGDKIQAEYSGVYVSSGTATRQIKLKFAGTTIFDTGALTLSLSSAWELEVFIIRVSATVIRYSVSFATQGAALSSYTASGELTGLTLSATNILKITGQAAGVGAATNDIVAKLAMILFIKLTDASQLFNDAEGQPAIIGAEGDGSSSYAARRDHIHAGGGTLIQNGVTIETLQKQTNIAYTTTGTSTAYTLTTLGTPITLTTNERWTITFHTNSGASPTLARDGLAAKGLYYRDFSGALQVCSSLLFTGMTSDVIYDGVRYIVLDILPPLTVNRQTFASPATNTWTKPAGVKFVKVILIGAGGGGGGGGRGTGAVSRQGGSGGGGGAYREQTFVAGDLGATEDVITGAGGIAGLGATAVPAAATDGGGGGNSSFGTTPYITAYGGGGGRLGANTAISGGGGGGGGTHGAGVVGTALVGGVGGAPLIPTSDVTKVFGGRGGVGGYSTVEGASAEYGGGGGDGHFTNSTTNFAGSSLYGGGGGGCGGGTSAVPAVQAPSAGGNSNSYVGGDGGGAGTSGVSPSSGGSAPSIASNSMAGGGGGGGGSTITANTNGATGGPGYTGGGGGGGGAGTNTGVGGAGGVGGGGIVVVVSW